MSSVKNVSGEDLLVGWLGHRLVLRGQVVEVPDEDVYGYTQQAANWAPADAAAQSIHDAAAGTATALSEVLAEPGQPAGNASRDLWAAWAVATGRATEDDLDGMGREEIRDNYSNTNGSE